MKEEILSFLVVKFDCRCLAALSGCGALSLVSIEKSEVEEWAVQVDKSGSNGLQYTKWLSINVYAAPQNSMASGRHNTMGIPFSIIFPSSAPPMPFPRIQPNTAFQLKVAIAQLCPPPFPATFPRLSFAVYSKSAS